LLAGLPIALPAQTFTILHTFSNSDGANPQGALVQGVDGNFYGTTASGGVVDDGSVFRITPDGKLTTLYFFCLTGGLCPDGEGPLAGLALGTFGDLWGTTYILGAGSGGTVFRITPKGALTTMHSFCTQLNCPDGGASPYAPLVLGRDGAFYGTTKQEGNIHNGGTVFKIGLGGVLHTIHNFCRLSGCADGAQPVAGLIQGEDGNFYGTTPSGGTHTNRGCVGNPGCGTVFKITPNGVLTTLYSFCSLPECADGAIPKASLFQGADGNFYGTTTSGGLHQNANICSYGCGTVFRLTPNGVFTTLYNFCVAANCPDGAYPAASLYQATDGNFYGTTVAGGTNETGGGGGGTIFRITPAGTLTTMQNFTGAAPGSLIQGTDGKLYGTLASDNVLGFLGIVYRLDVGLSPFVMTNPTAAKAGSRVIILGTDLTGASAVSFNGTAATFKISSPTAIVTSVPTSATSGSITVTLPTGTLKSNVAFTVLP
jgi:uncharacterized repeat protein (TIGR03803 family)